MQTAWRRAMFLVVAGLLIPAIGCMDTRTSNQGGGSMLSAMSKITAGNIGDLTADEIQILTDAYGYYGESAALSDEEAQAIVDWLDQNNVQTVGDLENTGITPPPELESLIGST